MSTFSLLLVLAASAMHAWWNYLLKRSRGGPLFVGLTKVVEVVVFAPIFMVTGAREAVSHGFAFIPLIVVGAGLTLLNYVMLAMAYGRGDLSLVYPVSRGGVLLFLPVLGALVFHETLSALGFLALSAIVAGIVSMQLPALSGEAARALLRSMVSSPAVRFALLAALAAAGYTVWDKHAVQAVSPFTYFYAYTAIVACAYGGYVARRHSLVEIRTEWAAHRAEILTVGVLNTAAYLLILVALRDGVSSYVVALRQISVVFGALLGNRLLGETLTVPRQLGLSLLVLGSFLVAVLR